MASQYAARVSGVMEILARAHAAAHTYADGGDSLAAACVTADALCRDVLPMLMATSPLAPGPGSRAAASSSVDASLAALGSTANALAAVLDTGVPAVVIATAGTVLNSLVDQLRALQAHLQLQAPPRLGAANSDLRPASGGIGIGVSHASSSDGLSALSSSGGALSSLASTAVFIRSASGAEGVRFLTQNDAGGSHSSQAHLVRRPSSIPDRLRLVRSGPHAPTDTRVTMAPCGALWARWFSSAPVLAWQEFAARLLAVTAVPEHQLITLRTHAGLVDHTTGVVTVESLCRFLACFHHPTQTTSRALRAWWSPEGERAAALGLLDAEWKFEDVSPLWTTYSEADLASAIAAFSGGAIPGAFAGFAGRTETESALCSVGPGAFIVRFSSTRACAVALSYIPPESTHHLYATGAPSGLRTFTGDGMVSMESYPIVHELLSLSPAADGFVFRGRTYNTLAALVGCEKDTLVRPAISAVVSASASGHGSDAFHGVITYEQTISRLTGKVDGSHLLRLSQSQRGAIVVAYVTEGGRVAQSLITPAPTPVPSDGQGRSASSAVVCSGRIFPSLRAALTAHAGPGSILRHEVPADDDRVVLRPGVLGAASALASSLVSAAMATRGHTGPTDGPMDAMPVDSSGRYSSSIAGMQAAAPTAARPHGSEPDTLHAPVTSARTPSYPGDDPTAPLAYGRVPGPAWTGYPTPARTQTYETHDPSHVDAATMPAREPALSSVPSSTGSTGSADSAMRLPAAPGATAETAGVGMQRNPAAMQELDSAPFASGIPLRVFSSTGSSAFMPPQPAEPSHIMRMQSLAGGAVTTGADTMYAAVASSHFSPKPGLSPAPSPHGHVVSPSGASHGTPVSTGASGAFTTDTGYEPHSSAF